MSFIRIGDHEPNSGRLRRRRPRVFAWQLRWRLLLVVAMVVLVPSLIFQFVPGLRQWAGLEVTPSTQTPLLKEEIANEDVETRLLPRSESAERNVSGPVVSGVGDSHGVGRRPTDNSSQESALQVAIRDRWSRLRQQLSSRDRSQLQQALKAARDAETLSTNERIAWEAALKELENRWQEMGSEARAALANLPEHEKAEWAVVLDQLDTSWSGEMRPLLEVAGRGQPLTAAQQKGLADLQHLLDNFALADVRDNTVVRSVEYDAWFRLFEQLQTATPASLESATTGRLGFVQLFKQPEFYRGKLVTVRGDIRMAYRVAAEANHCGITSYYVYWLKPAGGPNRPMVIYALETPPGFPPLSDKELGEPPTELDEAAEFTGYFFKNWSYPAQDHTRLAPLLLARAPVWHPISGPKRGLPSRTAVITAVLSSIVFAVVLACFVYYKSQPPRRTETIFDSLPK